jgi:transcription termination factor Rho
VVGGSFDESHDRQGEVASMAVERAKRAAERGRHAAVVVDSLDLLPPGAARRVFGAARGTEEAGSVTVIAATGIGPEHSRHATTRIVLRPGQREATVDDETSMTLRADLLS